MFLKKIAYSITIGLIYICPKSSLSQDQKIADSLAEIYNKNQLPHTAKLELLKDLAFNELNDTELAIKYADELIELAKLENEKSFLYSGHLQKGNRYLFLGNVESALKEFFKSLDIAISTKDIADQGIANMSIADTYTVMENYSNAENFYNKSIELLRKTNDSIALASALSNLGDSYFQNKKYDKALKMFEESGLIFKKINNETGTAFILGNVGMVYAEQGKDTIAWNYMNDAIKILERQKHYYPVSVYLTYMSDIYVKKDNMPKAFEYAKRSLKLAKQYGLKEQISDANLKLSELYESMDNLDSASVFHQKYLDYKDSIINNESINKVADLRIYYEGKQKQAQIDFLIQKRKTQRIIFYATALALLSIIWLAIVLYRKNIFVRSTNKIISNEKQRSDNLLLNILPKDTAQELKDSGKVKAQRFESVSILFSDFEGFTRYAENLPPEEVVKAVDFYFSRFDEIIEKYGIEKIKTVGDAYMCAGGLPIPTQDHANKIVHAALEIINFVNEAKTDDQLKAKFDIRIGINTGPVVAGVVGNKKFAYDIWGDSVNIASRMESSSEPGKINISEDTYLLVKEKFNCKFRGEINVKNRGVLKMYFVENFNKLI